MVVEAVACRHVEPRVLTGLEVGEPRAARVARAQVGHDLLVGAAVYERSVHATVERRAGERLQLVVGTEHRRVVAADHLRHRLHAHVGEDLATELEERQVGAVGEQEQLEVQLVQLVVELEAAVVGPHQAVVRAEALLVNRLVLVFDLGQARDLERAELFDPCVDLRLPAIDE